MKTFSTACLGRNDSSNRKEVSSLLIEGAAKAHSEYFPLAAYPGTHENGRSYKHRSWHGYSQYLLLKTAQYIDPSLLAFRSSDTFTLEQALALASPSQ